MMTMTQPASDTGALPCVGIHLDDLVLAGALPARLAGTRELPGCPASAAVSGFAPGRPPLSDEVDEDEPRDAGDDEEEEDEEEDEEEEEEEDEGEEDEEDEEDDDDDEDEEEDEEEEKEEK